MSLALYMDVHVPAVITRTLMMRGLDVLTAQADGAARISDATLLDRATELRRVMFTRDDDFLTEASFGRRDGIAF